jgi:hypothetical protein
MMEALKNTPAASKLPNGFEFGSSAKANWFWFDSIQILIAFFYVLAQEFFWQ